jgi:hypothetical protein
MKSKMAAISNGIRIVHSTSIAPHTAPALPDAAHNLIPAVNSRVSPLLIAPSGWFRLPNVLTFVAFENEWRGTLGSRNQPKPAGRSDEKRAHAGINSGDEVVGSVRESGSCMGRNRCRVDDANSIADSCHFAFHLAKEVLKGCEAVGSPGVGDGEVGGGRSRKDEAMGTEEGTKTCGPGSCSLRTPAQARIPSLWSA